MHAPESAPSALVGRERELATLHERLASALAGHGSLVLISGEAGIGKTVLAEALCLEAMEQGARVLVGRCYDLTETPPYGPWVELFARCHELDRMPPLPDAFAQRGTVGEVGSQGVLVQQTLDFLTALATQQLVVLLLDDLQWADPASLDLLRFLARSLPSLPLLLVATYRDDELTRRHQLYQLLPVLVREAHAERLTLQPLPEAVIGTLIAGRFHLTPRDGGALVAYLYRRSEGNPLFLGELLRTLEEEAVLREAGDGWHVGDLAAVRVPALLQQVIDGRSMRLGEEVRHLLAIGAIIGQEIPLALWAAVADAADEEILGHAVEQAVDAHMLLSAPDGRSVRFIHALVREALYAATTPHRRRGRHRRIGEILATYPRADPDAVAYHFRQAEDGRAVAWLILAGERARGAYAWTTAVERFEAALALIDGGSGDGGQRGLVLYRLARMRRYADPRLAIDDLDEVARIAAAEGDRALAALALFCRGMSRNFLGDAGGTAELAAGVDALHALSAEETARLDRLERRTWPNVHGTLVQSLANVGRYTEALAVAERGERDEPPASATGNAPGGSFLADMQFGLGVAHAAMGRPDEARRAFARARDVYRGVEHHLYVGWAAVWDLLFVSLAYRADHLPERLRLAAEGEEALRHASGGVLAAGFSPRLASLPLMLVEGAWDEAGTLARAAIADPGVSWGNWGAFVPTLLGELARERGDPDLAWAQIHALLPDGPATEPTWQPFHCGQMGQRLAAALALDAGDLPLAREWLEAYDRWLGGSNAVLGRAEGALGWAAYHRAAGDADTAYRHASAGLASASEPHQPLALLAGHRLLGELDTDAGRYPDATRHLDAALTLADTCAAPFERALTLLAIATLHAATGLSVQAGTVVDEVRVLCTPLGAKRTLGRAAALAARLATMKDVPPSYPAGLSAREVEVLRLITAGRSNREIAAALFLAPGTVNIHVTHILAKTETANRTEAAAFALRHGLA